MDPEQYQYFAEADRLCGKLLGQLSADKESAPQCFRGDILQAYHRSTDRAIEKVSAIRAQLQALQAGQP